MCPGFITSLIKLVQLLFLLFEIMVLTTPGILGKLLEFLENSWNVEIFVQDPEKLLKYYLSPVS